MGRFWDKISGRTRINPSKLLEPAFVKGSLPNLNLIPMNLNKRPIYTNWNTQNAVETGYKASVFVYSCVTRLMKAAASVPWVVKELNRQGEWEVKPNHDIAKIFRSPNPFSTWQNQIETVTSHLNLGGNAIWFKARAAGKPKELWIIRPDYIKPRLDQSNYIAGYEYTLNGRMQFIPFEDIIHVLFVDPANPWWGLAPMKAASKVVDTDVESVNFNKVSMQNRGVPDGVFSFKDKLTKPQFEEAQTNIREGYLGSSNARTPMVLSGEAKWQRTSQTPAELDFLKSQSWTAERICSVFGVPPPIIGINMTTALANISTARQIFWLDTLIPYLNDLKDTLNHGLTSEWATDGSLMIDYDISNVQALQSLFTEKVKTGKDLWAMGVPFDEVNQRLALGFDPIPGGDVPWVPSTLQPADDIPEDDFS